MVFFVYTVNEIWNGIYIYIYRHIWWFFIYTVNEIWNALLKVGGESDAIIVQVSFNYELGLFLTMN